MTTRPMCIGLQQALRLSTAFSAYAARQEVPSGLEVPVPTDTYCEFVPKAWNSLQDHEREAFQRFYQEVGNDLEDLARDASDGGDVEATLDAVAWEDITRGLRARR